MQITYVNQDRSQLTRPCNSLYTYAYYFTNKKKKDLIDQNIFYAYHLRQSTDESTDKEKKDLINKTVKIKLLTSTISFHIRNTYFSGLK